ncbi:unnamed protein product [Arabidopsis arenosa]|uniref:Transposase-associated domain-containing protein n=1 Tax=Arabidopsis arenosa TaxID=38785 RepID=A0A8S1ZS84_ARAAE|nr:unnamed protein product [Arabidopsis arenosa]
MDKAWAWLPRNSLEYEIGARNFVSGASSNLGNPTEMFCPCVDCRNVCHQLIETVLDHLVIRGMDLKYKRNPCWSKHGDMTHIDKRSVDGENDQEPAEGGEQSQPAGGGEPSQPAEGETVDASTGGGSPQKSNSTTKRTRGQTKMRKVAKDPLSKVEVDFTSLGEHCGSGSVTLSSFLGPLVREHVTVLLDDWRKLDEQTKDTMWEEIQGRQKHAVLKQMGCVWRASKSKLVGQIRAAGSHAERLRLKPSNIQSLGKWNNWVKSKTSTEFKEKSERYRNLRRAQIPHTTSRKGMFRLAHDLKKKSSDPKKVTRSKVWIAGHTHKDGRPVKPEFVETIEQIKTIDSQMESTANDNISEDDVSQVLGKDRPGRIRGLGRGITATKLAFLQARDTHVQNLEAKQAELLSQILDLKSVVNDLAGKRKHSETMGAQSEVSDVSRGVRCQLLEWGSTEDVIVGEGEFCSADPAYKIGRIPLGPNVAAVVVKSVTDKDSPLWRPTPTMFSLGEAVGLKIPWQADKVILDDNYPKSPNRTSDSKETISNESIQRCKVFDWNSHGEVIAEGVLCSTDPAQMVDNIPLGKNAAIVKIDLIVKAASYVWRPSATVLVISDALDQEVPWPINKIEIITQNAGDDSVRKSPGTNSGSSKGVKKKCILLDCKNSGKTVAEGRVCSTDPAALLHFKPIGPNASKVWVDVSKIDDAKVWRPSSEVKFISDAIGTLVVWPNDKIVYV